MTIAYEPTKVDGVIELVIGSSSLQDLCKRIVHADFVQGTLKGAYLYLLDAKSGLSESAGYGVSALAEGAELSAWDNSVEAKAIRTKNMISNGEQTCIPLIKDHIPVGCLSLSHTKILAESPVSESVAPTLGKLIAFFVEASTVSIGAKPGSRPAGSVEDITTRQVQILELMGDGLTNAEIAGRVLLSESTVRQETIRIYRALGVASRQEAVARGRAIGLIPKLGITPPPRQILINK